MRNTTLAAIAATVLIVLCPAHGQRFGFGGPPSEAPEEESAVDFQVAVEKTRLRSIGPANMGGRITSIAVYEADPSTYWLATASGGLLKTTNNGISFEHQFDHEATVSIGDVAVAPSDPNVVWVGTGESNPRNSVSWGDGVYKSIDGGKTWEKMGLGGSYQIGEIRIHPTNPDIVYVGALGRLWGENPDRGLYKTTDGGKSWEKILYVDEKTGVIDIAMHPRDPEILLVATYERQRDGFDTNDPAKKWGPGSGLYRTTDGGKTFKKITEGLPSCAMGRIGLDWCRTDPNVVFMVLESEKIGTAPETFPYAGFSGADAEVGARITDVVKDAPAAKAGLEKGDIVISVEGETVHSYAELLRAIRRHEAGETVKVEVSRDRKPVFCELALTTWPKPKEGEDEEDARRARGFRRGRNQASRNPFSQRLGGQPQNMQDQQGHDGHEYGGIYRSDDGGETWKRVNSLNPRPMYFSEIRVDPSDANYVYVAGISLYRSKDGGKTFTADGAGRGVHVDHHAIWVDPRDGRHILLGNDGGHYVTYDRMKSWDHLNHFAIGQFYHVAVGPRKNYRVYGGLQDNGSWGAPHRIAWSGGPTNSDWMSVGGGDGFICRVDPNDPDLVYFESQNGGMGRRNLRTGERGFIRPAREEGQPRPRFNWRTPYILSAHNSKIFYAAGNRVYRSLDRGDDLRPISPEITATDRGSATALAESPHDPNVLWVGTDDGALWMTRNGGHDWIDLYRVGAPVVADRGEAPADPKVVAAKEETGEKPAAETTEKTPAPKTAENAASAENATEPAPQTGARADAAAPASPRREGAAPRRATGRRGNFAARLMERDANGDGKLQASELPERMRRMIGRLDTDGDGVLDAKELAAARGRRGGRRGGRPGARNPDAAGGAEVRSGRSGRSDRRAGRRRRAGSEPTPGGAPIAQLVPERRWVSELCPSRHVEGRIYLTFDGHRSDDDQPLLFVSEDWGETWRSIRGNLPDQAGSVRTISEDRVRPDLLYLGCEFGAWVTNDRGETWTRLAGLPTVAVHAFAQHETLGDVVVGTHGRSLWVFDATMLRQITPEVLAQDAYLFEPPAAILWRSEPSRGGTLRRFVGENPPSGCVIHYALGRRTDPVQLRILGPDGKVVRTLEADGAAGIHRVVWDLRQSPRRRGAANRGFAGRFRGFRGGRRVRPGTYAIELVAGEERLLRTVTVEIDPDHPDESWLEAEWRAEELEAEYGEDEESEEPIVSGG